MVHPKVVATVRAPVIGPALFAVTIRKRRETLADLQRSLEDLLVSQDAPLSQPPAAAPDPHPGARLPLSDSESESEDADVAEQRRAIDHLRTAIAVTGAPSDASRSSSLVARTPHSSSLSPPRRVHVLLTPCLIP